MCTLLYPSYCFYCDNTELSGYICMLVSYYGYSVNLTSVCKPQTSVALEHPCSNANTAVL